MCICQLYWHFQKIKIYFWSNLFEYGPICEKYWPTKACAKNPHGSTWTQGFDSLSRFWKTVTGLASLSLCFSKHIVKTEFLRSSLCSAIFLLLLPPSSPDCTHGLATGPVSCLSSMLQRPLASSLRPPQANKNSWAVRDLGRVQSLSLCWSHRDQRLWGWTPYSVFLNFGQPVGGEMVKNTHKT